MNKGAALAAGVLVIALVGCASGYQAFYRPTVEPEVVQKRRASPPPETPSFERASPAPAEVILYAYAKRGYLMIGYSEFNSGRVEPEGAAVLQGRRVGADLVLVLNPQYTGSITTSVPITVPTSTTSYSSGTATAYGAGGSVNAYGNSTTTTYGSSTTYIPVTEHRSNYTAVYFVKAKIHLGVLIRELSDDERRSLGTNRAVAVMVVVNDSPAYNADILVGDYILELDGQIVSSQQEYGRLLEGKRGGDIVNLTLGRGGSRIVKQVQLAAPVDVEPVIDKPTTNLNAEADAQAEPEHVLRLFGHKVWGSSRKIWGTDSEQGDPKSEGP